MTEMVRVTEKGGRFHRDQENGEGVVCGSTNGNAQRVSRGRARVLGYQPCGTCYQYVKDVNGFTLYQETTERWTEGKDASWTCYTDKDLVLCQGCGELIRSGDEVYFCVLAQKPLHQRCRSDCSASAGAGEKHLHRPVVFVDQGAREERLEQLREEEPDGPGQEDAGGGTAEKVLDAVQGQKVQRRVVEAVKAGSERSEGGLS